MRFFVFNKTLTFYEHFLNNQKLVYACKEQIQEHTYSAKQQKEIERIRNKYVTKKEREKIAEQIIVLSDELSLR